MTSALISVFLMVLLFISHSNIVAVQSWYSCFPEVLRRQLCGLADGGEGESQDMWEIQALLLLHHCVKYSATEVAKVLIF